MAHRIFIVEDHDWLREMLTEYVGGMPGLEVSGVAGTGEAALAALATVPTDLVLVDLSLPQMGGAEVVQQVRSQWPDLYCIILSAHSDRSVVEPALDSGAHGYVHKNDPDELGLAIRAVLNGERYISADVQFAATGDVEPRPGATGPTDGSSAEGAPAVAPRPQPPART